MTYEIITNDNGSKTLVCNKIKASGYDRTTKNYAQQEEMGFTVIGVGYDKKNKAQVIVRVSSDTLLLTESGAGKVNIAYKNPLKVAKMTSTTAEYKEGKRKAILGLSKRYLLSQIGADTPWKVFFAEVAEWYNKLLAEKSIVITTNGVEQKAC